MKTTIQNLIRKIYAKESHRSSQATYQALIDLGLARYVDWKGWELTESGMEIAKKLSSK